MKSAACVSFLVLWVSGVSAQTPSRAQLVLTILGGGISGHSLWEVRNQPVTAGAEFDTLHLRRDVSSSVVLGASATYFFSSHFGMHAEISYMGLPMDDGCTAVHIAPGDTARIQAACDDIASRAGSGGAISLFLGATLRASAAKSLSPYIRGNIGIVSMPHSYVEVSGNYFLTGVGPQELPVIKDLSPRSGAPYFGLAGGLTQPLSKSGGYQIRLELRDAITSFEQVAGPADPATQVAPTEIKTYHHLSLTLGLDIVLEKARGRRY
ncbi:MAG TPA: hypothetical protein VKD28_04645 [Gemmatimonadales bacterium]|nr:hypothetical protein [Gemmatimonadales bacterium]